MRSRARRRSTCAASSSGDSARTSSLTAQATSSSGSSAGLVAEVVERDAEPVAGQHVEHVEQLRVHLLVLEQLDHDVLRRQRERADVEEELARDVDPGGHVAHDALEPDVGQRGEQHLRGRGARLETARAVAGGAVEQLEAHRAPAGVEQGLAREEELRRPRGCRRTMPSVHRVIGQERAALAAAAPTDPLAARRPAGGRVSRCRGTSARRAGRARRWAAARRRVSTARARAPPGRRGRPPRGAATGRAR